MPSALILGAGGQDGVLLSRFLLSMGYEVHCVARDRGSNGVAALSREAPGAILHVGSVTDANCLKQLFELLRPKEIYNLAAESSVALSWTDPEACMNTNILGTLGVLTAALARSSPEWAPRIYHASSSEMFGRTKLSPQSETTGFQPVSPYGISKVSAHQLVDAYRRAHGVFAACGILYNHESHLRPERFVTRKITAGVARIKLGLAETVTLGDLTVSRDWGYAGDYVRAMWLMLQQAEPDDFVIASGTLRPLDSFLAAAFSAVEIDDWRDRVLQDPRFMRPNEVSALVGDPAKAHSHLGWKSEVSFDQMVHLMVEADLRRLHTGMHS